ncbi:MAG: Ig-like domain-containing protein [Gemmatimonadales bacterium]
MRLRPILVAAVSTAFIVACYNAATDLNAPDDGSLTPSAARNAPSQKVKAVTVSPSSASIQAGAQVQLTATSKPPGTTSFVWASSNQSVATVNQSGLVTGVAAGSATISATAGGKTGTSAITVTSVPPPPPPGETFWAAGDIADCTNNNDEATARLLDGTTGTVAVLGDNAYENGSTTDYNNCYQPTWGRHKSRTMPSVGNHEYQTANASGYFGYFGAAAGDPTKGYYSYNAGDWHIVVLNSNIARDATSAQIGWLRSDLVANTKSCTLAYWHHPRFSSGSSHGNDATQQAFWDVLYEFNAEVILNGHEHNYERFAPQNPSAVADASRGIREFVVGTGGRGHYALGTVKANSVVFDSTSFGVLKMILSNGSYTWQFMPIAGNTFTDSGSGTCH